WFRRALQLDHSNDVARARLVDAYFSRKDYAAVVSLFSDAGVTETTDSETLLRIATSLQKRGDTSKAISVLESVLPSRSEEGPLYLALAQYYTEVRNPKKAADLSQKGKSLLAEAAVKPCLSWASGTFILVLFPHTNPYFCIIIQESGTKHGCPLRLPANIAVIR